LPEIITTTAVEAVHRQFRKLTKTKGYEGGGDSSLTDWNGKAILNIF